MARLFSASIAVLGALTLAPGAVEAQKQTPEKGALPRANQVYVKIILPADPAAGDKGRPVVESWIAEQLKKRGQTRFTAATAWVALTDQEERNGKRFTRVWDGGLGGKAWGCSVAGRVAKRADGRMEVLLDGWSPGYASVTVSLADEPGSREIAPVEGIKAEHGQPYAAVLIGPPPETPAAATGKSR